MVEETGQPAEALRESQNMIFTSRVSGRGHRIGAVCVCVCVSVNTLTAKPFDLRP